MSRPLLILRPEPGASRTAQAAAALGLAVDCYPLFLTTPIPWTGPEPHFVDAVMFTSANGARLAGPQLDRYRHLPAYAVGEVTAEAVRAAGFAPVHVGTRGVQELAAMIADRGHQWVLHISGRDIRTFDPGDLRVTSASVYASVESGHAADFAPHLVPGGVILIHSPRAGQRLADLVPPPVRATLHIAAISPAALEAAGGGWASGHAAARPDDAALLALAAGLCE
ncbi:uroporphyrinogen-III synthase [Sphingobium phenoxybenzoativorans]|uniref:Uroporphyrinogen-III synthase n=1 Tax=Sphingobium phenoxybenzoativorans TaxID=1592790 RepID=A0A975K816_9SPHN|nr:uroporphyrinogen-III synthase [Sphingobium phenoxybenzoativorans]QUT06182.1 uroporphyrinogen-III synthase [Sphingobium phenoxybenzoativorans]